MITKFFQAAVVLIGLTVVVPALSAATQSIQQRSIQQKVMLGCRTETTKNAAGVEYVKVLVTNNTTKTIPEGKAINFLVNTDTRGSFSLNFALAPGKTASYQTRLTGKVSTAPKAWIVPVPIDG